MEVGTPHERLQLVGVAASILSVSGMKRLMYVTHKMHQVFQCIQPFSSGALDSKTEVNFSMAATTQCPSGQSRSGW